MMTSADAADEAGHDSTVRICVNGKEVFASPCGKRANIDISGPVTNLRALATVSVTGAVGNNVQTNGDVTCHDVGNNVNAGGNVTCCDVGNNVSAGGSVTCCDVGNNAAAGSTLQTKRQVDEQ